jgi:hypothetical protein
MWHLCTNCDKQLPYALGPLHLFPSNPHICDILQLSQLLTAVHTRSNFFQPFNAHMHLEKVRKPLVQSFKEQAKNLFLNLECN